MKRSLAIIALGTVFLSTAAFAQSAAKRPASIPRSASRRRRKTSSRKPR